MSRQPYIYTMPESFLKDKSVPARWRVLGVINGFIINGGCFYGSNEWLMEQLGCTEPTVSAAFAELESLNLVDIRRTARSRKVYRKAHDPNELGSETQTEPSHDPSQLGPNSVSNSEKNSFADADAPQVVKVYEEEEGPQKKESRTKDKLAVYTLFSSREQPWWRHAHQKKAALALFDLVGMDKLRAGVALMKEHSDDKYCPQAGTPYEYEEQMPGLARYVKRNGL